jgi:hypothetical protein
MYFVSLSWVLRTITQPGGLRRRFASSLCLALAVCLAGCSTPRPQSQGRHFNFHEDTFAYANQLVWEYDFDPVTGRATHHATIPPPDYFHHCFVVARSARQFFENARFDPAAPLADDDTYRGLIKAVVASSPRHPLPPAEQIIIPGYSNLFTFSRARGNLLKQECGGAWQSYFQRGHWRMIFALTRSHQEAMARQFARGLDSGHVPVVHVVRFPSLSINHAMVLFDHKDSADQIEFSAYDPNNPEHPVPITFNRQEKRFQLPTNKYFAGGRVDLYEIYYRWNY